MKIIEALKKIKDLNIKASDLRDKIGAHSADLNFETPLYPDQKATVDGWLQAHHDITKEILRLHTAVQKTNLATKVTMDLSDVNVTRTIAEWVLRRRLLAPMEMQAWAKLTDRNLREGYASQSSGAQVEIRIRRYYDPKQRDEKVALYKSEPHTIDSTLEVFNAVTDLIE